MGFPASVRASLGVPVTPLPRGLPEIREWPLEVLQGAFEASTLRINTVEAMGELLGDITPSWASAPALALLASWNGEPPLSVMSWTRVSSRAGGSGAMGDSSGPVGVDTSPVLDADAEGEGCGLSVKRPVHDVVLTSVRVVD